MTVFDDLPTTVDQLNWTEEIKFLSNRIQKCHTPHVLGIHGNWGSGKTSLMRQVQHSLGGMMPNDGTVSHPRIGKELKNDLKKKIATVWFDAWRYQNEPVPIVALLHEMRTQLPFLEAIKNNALKLSGIALFSTINLLSDISKIIGVEGMPSADRIQKIGENWEAKNYQTPLEEDSIRKKLHDTISSLLPNNGRLVIFIDDLDRCEPSAVIRLLEGLKIYLSIPNCVFVLGMNETVLIDAIKEKISVVSGGDKDLAKFRASHYLEKICTDVYRLPIPKDSAELFSKWIEDPNQKEWLLKAIGTTTCLPPNPRRIKALANQWTKFASKVAMPDTTELEKKVWAIRILVAAYIHQFHRDIWERWHFNLDFWEECKAWCKGEGKQEGDQSPWHLGLQKTRVAAATGDAAGNPQWSSSFPNPGDINIFWIDQLVRDYEHHLTSNDFKQLLNY